MQSFSSIAPDLLNPAGRIEAPRPEHATALLGQERVA
jgi:hypothetical protein